MFSIQSLRQHLIDEATNQIIGTESSTNITNQNNNDINNINKHAPSSHAKTKTNLNDDDIIAGPRQRQMIICENEPMELPKDVVRSDTKVDDGIHQIKLNLNNILEKFEKGSVDEGSASSQPSSASIMIERPRYNIKQKLAAFENNQTMPDDDEDEGNCGSDETSTKQQQSSASAAGTPTTTNERPIVGKLPGHLTGFLNRESSQDEQIRTNNGAKQTVKRSQSLLGRLKKFESRIAGESVVDDNDSSSGDDQDDQRQQPASNNKDEVLKLCPSKSVINTILSIQNREDSLLSNNNNNNNRTPTVPKLETQFDLSELKNRWENGDIKNVSHEDDDEQDNNGAPGDNNNEDHKNNINMNGQTKSQKKINQLKNNFNNITTTTTTTTTTNYQHDHHHIAKDKSNLVNDSNDHHDINSPLATSSQKDEELFQIRQQLAERKRSSKAGSVRNIYENALKEAEQQQKNQLASSRRDSSDLSTLNGLSTSEIQQQLLQQQSQSHNNNLTQPTIIKPSSLAIKLNSNINNLQPQQDETDSLSSPSTATITKDHFQLNLTRKANKLKAKFELGLINNNANDDSDLDESSNDNLPPQMSKLEQIRQEKMEDLSVFTDGEISARKARNLFQQIDRRLSSGATASQPSSNGTHTATNSRTQKKAKSSNYQRDESSRSVTSVGC